MMDLRNKNITVVGLGASGIDACLLLDDAGAIVSATDAGDAELVRKNAETLKSRYMETEIGRHTAEFLKGKELIIVSPGVPKDALPVRYAMENNIPIIGELELAFQFCRGPIIAITGTNGKSTVTRLTGEILEKAGRKVVVCGNIGNSFSGEAARIDRNTICVLEVSSFQLEWIVDFRPSVSCVLNITEDHLDRYKDFNDYARTKFKIFLNQGKNDAAIFNYDDAYLRNNAAPKKANTLFYGKETKTNGVYLENNNVIRDIGKGPRKIFEFPSTKLKGAYNKENILAAILILLTQNVKPEIIEKGLKEFSPLKHRMESVLEINGIEFVDDSKATNVDAAKRALQSIDGKVVLIAGGKDKGGNYSLVKDEIKSKVKKLILIGEAAPLIEKAFSEVTAIEKAGTLEEAVKAGFGAASAGETVLLSPMCSSFDMFSDYKERGDVFRKAVKALKGKTS